MQWPELRQACLALVEEPSDIEIKVREVPMPETLFVQACIKMIDDHPKKPDMTPEEKKFRLEKVKPFYDRLYAYYLLKSNF